MRDGSATGGLLEVAEESGAQPHMGSEAGVLPAWPESRNSEPEILNPARLSLHGHRKAKTVHLARHPLLEPSIL